MIKSNIQHDITIEFEHTVRNEIVYVEAVAWSDEEGIYKTQISDVSLNDVSVLGLLTEDDLSDIDDAIEPAIREDAADNCSNFNPSRDAHRLGE